MNDDRLIGNVLQLQTRRLTEMRALIDKLTAQAQANGDALERIHNSITKEKK